MPDPGALRDAGATATADNLEFWINRCRKVRQKMPQEARKILGSPQDVYQFCRNYTELWQAHELIPKIAQTEWPEPGDPNTAASFTEYRKLKEAQHGLPMGAVGSLSTDVIVGPDRRIGLYESPVLRALDGVRADRIKRCSIETCRRIFWAKQDRSKTCSTTCDANLRKRRQRASRPNKTKRQSESRKKKAMCERIQSVIRELGLAYDQPGRHPADRMQKWIGVLLEGGFTEAEIESLGAIRRGTGWDVSELLAEDGYTRALKMLSNWVP